MGRVKIYIFFCLFLQKCLLNNHLCLSKSLDLTGYQGDIKYNFVTYSKTCSSRTSGDEANTLHTVQSRRFFHQPAYPRGEGATIKRISPPRKPPVGGGDCGGSAAFPRWVLQIKIDRQSLPVFKFSWSPPRVLGGIK